MTYIEKEPLLETVKAMQDDSAFGVPRIIAAIENAPASEVAREIFEDIKRTLDTAIWTNDLEIKTNRAIGFNSDAEKFAVRKKAIEDAKDYLRIVEKKYTEDGK